MPPVSAVFKISPEKAVARAMVWRSSVDEKKIMLALPYDRRSFYFRGGRDIDMKGRNANLGGRSQGRLSLALALGGRS